MGGFVHEASFLARGYNVLIGIKISCDTVCFIKAWLWNRLVFKVLTF